MAIESISGASTPPPVSGNQTNPTKAAGVDALANKDTFLQLLVAQLKNQNPLSPTDGTQFVTQLAQFSSLEQSTQMRDDLAAIRTDFDKYFATNSTKALKLYDFIIFNSSVRSRRHHYRHRRSGQQPGEPQHNRVQDQRCFVPRSGDPVAGRRSGRDPGRIRRWEADHARGNSPRGRSRAPPVLWMLLFRVMASLS